MSAVAFISSSKSSPPWAKRKLAERKRYINKWAKEIKAAVISWSLIHKASALISHADYVRRCAKSGTCWLVIMWRLCWKRKRYVALKIWFKYWSVGTFACCFLALCSCFFFFPPLVFVVPVVRDTFKSSLRVNITRVTFMTFKVQPLC